MRKRSQIVMAMSLLLVVQTTNAQFLKKLKNKVKNKVENKAMSVVDKKTDNVLEGSEKNKTTQMSNPDIKDTYVFNQGVVLELQAQGSDKAEVEFLFSSSNINIACMTLNASDKTQSVGEKIYTVFTPENATMFMDMPGIKIKKSVAATDFQKFDNSEKIPNKEELKKTGNTKSILGYTCHEYLYEKDGAQVQAWVTQNFLIKNTYLPIMGMTPNGPYNGFVLELHYKSPNDSGSVKVIEINKNLNITIKTKDYKSM